MEIKTRSSLHNLGPVVLPDTFTGDGNFDHWINHFENVSVVNKWNDNG